MTSNPLITAFGAVSPLGLGAGAQVPQSDWVIDLAATPAGAPAAGGTGIAEIPAAFSIKDYVKPVGLRRKQRFSQLAMAAAVEAHATATATAELDADRTGVVLTTEYGPQRVVSDYLAGLLGKGLAEASPGLFTQTVYNVANGQASLALGLRGANSTLVASSAIAYAASLITAAKADAIVALAVDETNTVMAEYYDRATREADVSLVPFTIGEAAVAVVVEGAESAHARGATPLAEVLGVQIASAAGVETDYLQWDPADDAFAYTMRTVLAAAGLDVTDVALVVGAGNGLVGLSTSELACLADLGYEGRLALPRVATGECFGANEGLAVLLGLDLAAPGDIVLINVATANGGATSILLRKAS